MFISQQYNFAWQYEYDQAFWNADIACNEAWTWDNL